MHNVCPVFQTKLISGGRSGATVWLVHFGATRSALKLEKTRQTAARTLSFMFSTFITLRGRRSLVKTPTRNDCRWRF